MKNKKLEIKKYNGKEVKEMAIHNITYENDKISIIKEFGEDIFPAYFNGNKKEKEIALLKLNTRGIDLLRIFENEKHIGLMESFEKRYQNFSIEMTKNMINEFKCSNEAEKALAELIVNAYIRVVDNSRRLNNELESKEITPNRNIYIANLSKQVDRANRQYISALMALKQLKSPQIEMNIRTNTAFIANNQQINTKENENINT